MTNTFAFPAYRTWAATASACGLSLGLVACGGSDDDAATVFMVGGSVSGLTTSGLVLQNNGTDDLAVPANANAFVFGAAVPVNQPYSVSVKAQPQGLECAVSRGQGRATADVSDVTVTCAPVAAGGGGSGSGEVGTGASRDCFNPALLTPGTRYRWHMQTRVEGQLVSMIQERQIEGGGSFAGASGLLVDGGSMNVTMGSSGTMNQSGAWYYELRDTDAGPIIVEHGGFADSTVSVAGMTLNSQHEYINMPAAEKREFALQKGQSYQYSATTRTSSTISGSMTTVDTSTETYNVTYLGQKEVTVAAGTFPACHFTQATTEGPVDVYTAVGSGLPLVIASRMDDGGVVRMEMQGDSHVNGVPVSQYHAVRR